MTTLITGASAGIGLEFAHVFASHSHDLILVARREDKLVALKKSIEKKYSVSVDIIIQDLTEKNAAKNIYEKIKHTPLDVLVNNAGFGAHGSFIKTDSQKEIDMIQVNITALTELTKYILPGMIQRGSGKILQVASTAAFEPGPLMAVYFATKAYVLSFSEAIAEEVRGTGVSVTCLCPGATTSEFSSVASMEKVSYFADKNLPTSHDVAQYGYDALMKGTVVAIHGMRNKFLTFLLRFTPRSVVRKIVKKLNNA